MLTCQCTLKGNATIRTSVCSMTTPTRSNFTTLTWYLIQRGSLVTMDKMHTIYGMLYMSKIVLGSCLVSRNDRWQNKLSLAMTKVNFVWRRRCFIGLYQVCIRLLVCICVMNTFRKTIRGGLISCVIKTGLVNFQRESLIFIFCRVWCYSHYRILRYLRRCAIRRLSSWWWRSNKGYLNRRS